MSENKIQIREDCVFFKNHRNCYALKKMYCHKEICSFYKAKEEKEHKNDSK